LDQLMAGGDGGGVGLGGEAAQAIDVDSAVIAAVAPSTAASRQTCRGQLIVGRVWSDIHITDTRSSCATD
jgi:hypothetical protein